jgi:DNA-binding beta-propeller fold protein YncE
MIARRSISLALVWLCAAAGALAWCSTPALGQRLHEFSKSFGSEGSGDGQLMRPGQLAVNEETGDVYVVDRGNDRVEIFNAKGEYVSQFNGSASPTGSFSWPTTNKIVAEPEGEIAVDSATNSLDPSRGDVYVLDSGHNVIDKFTASGAYIGQLRFPNSIGQLESIGGLAVDPDGSLWVQNSELTRPIYELNDALVNEHVSSVEPYISNEGTHVDVPSGIGLAFDSEDNFYIGLHPDFFEKRTVPAEFSKTGEALVEKLDEEETTGLAVDLSSNDVYVDHETSVAVYRPSGPSVERFGSGQMEASEGIAVDSRSGTVYTSNANSQQIEVFTAFVVPDATTGAASNLTETSATISGVVNPDGLPVTSCVFEYGPSESYGQSEPCSPSPGGGAEPETVTAQLKDLTPLAMYHYRLKASNANGPNVGQDRTFVAPEPVTLSEEAVSDVSSESALFSVQVDPGGADTTYQFEYGPSESYGESVPVPAGDLGSGTSSEPVSIRVEGLLGQTVYHVRVVAINLFGAVYGRDETFTTQGGGGAFALPDGREWELVSPPNKEGALIDSIGGGLGARPLIEASAAGGAFSYGASAPLGESPSGNPAPFGTTEVLAKRGADGWSSADIAVPQQAAGEDVGTEYTFFSPDLSQAIVEPSGMALLSPEATEETPYVRENGSGSYLPLVTASNVPPGTKFGPFGRESDTSAPDVLAVTPDFSHFIISSHDALTSHAVPSIGNLYEWSGGRLQLVSVLSDGTAVKFAELGGFRDHDARNALSSDGSRVFFTTEAGGETSALYMRDTVTNQTVQVSAPASGVSLPPGAGERAKFEIASADGSEAFFVDEEPLTPDSKLSGSAVRGSPDDLYVCQIVEEAGEPKCDLTDLTVDQNPGEAAEVQGQVAGASEDGSVVYFVAKGVLAAGGEAGQDNLYVVSKTGSSWSSPRLIAVLSEEDDRDWAQTPAYDNGELELLTARVSPNGRYLAFMSERSLTGYDNRDANSGQPDEEVFLYDEATSQLRCVSCDPTGARPTGVFERERGGLLVDEPGAWERRWFAANIPGWTEAKQPTAYYQSRVLSNEGRMFFDSPDALVPQDTDGREDVYEYEPVGVGGLSGCAPATQTYVASMGGCVSLISSGTSSEESAFLDASETGDDVFFLTAARLVPQDIDSSFDVYDAHVCSAGVPCVNTPVSPPPCASGDGCKAAPSLQPAIFGAPSSATFSGTGNVTQSAPATSASTSTKGTKRVSHGKRKPKPKRKRRRKSKSMSSRARKSLSAGTGR